MSAIEHELIERISHLDADKQRLVLAFVRDLESDTPTYSARELMKLPFEERNRILLEQLQQAEDEDFEIFEAYSEEDFDESS
jgi:hypothetical protein